MSMPLEHDYIGLSEVPSMVTSEKVSSTITTTTTTTTTSDTNSKNSERNSATGLNLKATELRLGLPGSQSPERTTTDHHHKDIVEDKNVYPLGVLKSLVSGAKRGFSDTIDIGSGKWGFSGTGGSECDLVKNGGLFSPRGKNGGKPVSGPEVSQQLGLVNDAVAKFPRPVQEKKAPQVPASNGHGSGPASKAQVVGWPPVRSFRKNTMAYNPPKNDDNLEGKLGSGCLYVKVSMDDAPYLRKLDLQTCGSYVELSTALEKMFSCFTIGSGQSGSDGVPNRDVMNKSRLMDLLHGSEYVLTFEDKDGDWMLVGDVPWKMFTVTCKRLRIIKSSEAIGLAPRAMEKCKNRN